MILDLNLAIKVSCVQNGSRFFSSWQSRLAMPRMVLDPIIKLTMKVSHSYTSKHSFYPPIWSKQWPYARFSSFLWALRRFNWVVRDRFSYNCKLLVTKPSVQLLRWMGRILLQSIKQHCLAEFPDTFASSWQLSDVICLEKKRRRGAVYSSSSQLCLPLCVGRVSLVSVTLNMLGELVGEHVWVSVSTPSLPVRVLRLQM